MRDETLTGSHLFSREDRHAVIAAGGVEEAPDRTALHLGRVDLVLAADGGFRLLPALGLSCDVLVGDFDTLTEVEVEKARSAGVRVRQFPSNKAQSDLEIAIEEAHRAGATRVTLVGALGGAWDHCVANLLSPLSLCADHGMWARLLTAQSQIYLARGRVRIQAPGQRVSLAALSEVVEELTLRGMEYPLEKARLSRSQTLGLANRALDPSAFLDFTSGELLITVLHS